MSISLETWQLRRSVPGLRLKKKKKTTMPPHIQEETTGLIAVKNTTNCKAAPRNLRSLRKLNFQKDHKSPKKPKKTRLTFRMHGTSLVGEP